MTKYTATLLLVLLPVAGCGAGTDADGGSEAHRAPNIVVILADDAGYADFGFQGSAEAATPYIDAIAANGVTYTDAYEQLSDLFGELTRKPGAQCERLL